MSQETPSSTSPFSALSYQEQQARWLEWRSRQLDYRPAAAAEKPMEAQAQEPPKQPVPSLRTPNMRIAAPTRHRELDDVLSRHQKALRQAGPFQTTSIG